MGAVNKWYSSCGARRAGGLEGGQAGRWGGGVGGGGGGPGQGK